MKLWLKSGKVVLNALGKLVQCADCPCGDKCCGNPASTLCAYLSSSDGCNACMNGQVVTLTKSDDAWNGSLALSCGTVTITLACDVGPGCTGYYLTFQCGADSTSRFPTSCTCDPFSLGFAPITLTGCCSGTVTVTITDDCPETTEPGG